MQPSAKKQIQFLLNIGRLLQDGSFVATYKHALLLSIADVCVEKGDDSGAKLRISIDDLAEKLSEYEQGLTDIEGFSHLFVLWLFDRVDGFDLLATPPTDTRQHGVFATRSPRRPNPIGLTVVRLLGRDGCRLRVAGVDMLDGTPILDCQAVPVERPESIR